MATVSSTSSSSSTSTTSAATTAKTSAAALASKTAKSLLDSLNGSDNIDTGALVGQLVDAQFATRKAQLAAKSDQLTAQISGVSTIKDTIATFTKAVKSLADGGTLTSQPVSSNAAAITGTTISGASIADLNTTIKVTALATAQVSTSAKVTSPGAATFGTGTLTLKLGTATYGSDGQMTGFTTGTNADNSAKSFDIAIDSSNNTLSGIAAAINAKKTGVTASVLTDADGSAFLSLKGATGTQSAFQLTADDPASDLGRFDVRARGSGDPATLPTKLTGQAANAVLDVDGARVERASNEVTDLVAGVKLSLTGTGTATLTAKRPTAQLTDAVKAFVETYNQVLAVVKEQTDPINGKLRGDTAARALQRTLQSLSSTSLLPNAASGTPSSLAAIGVRTLKDGTLEVDDKALSAAMTRSPDAIEAMFAYSPVSKTGLYQVMQSIQLNSSSSLYGLGASTNAYRQAQADLTKRQSTLDDQVTRTTDRMTQQFSSMGARVNAYKTTQSFMDQQIKTWTKG
ncbi:flagellar filament capping protein FliD [Sphingomonas sp. CCH9-F2]|uniref:flagellar filament capping protein FliD n=1 Tax=Sphingomonas sp. CCH9-F2 TaxID=1768778 RepID=UPI0008378441|nr:flagellar filament capping protein FliD [Sphingomonas sp. CCH9-F2]